MSGSTENIFAECSKRPSSKATAIEEAGGTQQVLLGVLPRYHGRLHEESLSLLLHFQPPPLPRIMKSFDVVENIGPGFSSHLVVLPIHTFACEHPEEALGHGIIGATAHRAHAADDLICLQKTLVFLGSKLTAAIRVQHDRRAGRELPQCHQDGLDHQLAVLTWAHRPPHHENGIQIQHDA